jgi:hypothetical protein
VKGVAALSVIFALVALILAHIGWDAKTPTPLQVASVFAGLWAMSISIVVHNLLSK